MTLPQTMRLFDYWRSSPPEHEMIAMLARVYTTWRGEEREVTPEDHMRSLEERWKSGAMNLRDLFQAGGFMGKHDPKTKPPGIGDFPGRTVH